MKLSQKTLAALAVAAAAVAWSAPAQAGRTLNAVKSRGSVVCGVNTAAPGFSNADSKGNWTGLDVDICRAVAAAVLGDARKVKFVPLASEQRFTALQSGQIDVLARNTTWSMSVCGCGLRGWAGLHGSEEVQDQFCQEAERRHDLRADRHVQRKESSRFRASKQHQVQACCIQHDGSHAGSIHFRAMPGLHNGSLGSCWRPVARKESERLCDSSGYDQQGAAGHGRPPRR